jgi:hypothetical protein
LESSEERSQLIIATPLAVVELCAEMRFLSYKSVRVVLLNTKRQLIKVVTISQGTLNEALSHPGEIFKPVIVFSAHAFVLVHNHASRDPAPSEADPRLTRRILEASKILRLHACQHFIPDLAQLQSLDRSGCFLSANSPQSRQEEHPGFCSLGDGRRAQKLQLIRRIGSPMRPANLISGHETSFLWKRTI